MKLTQQQPIPNYDNRLPSQGDFTELLFQDFLTNTDMNDPKIDLIAKIKGLLQPEVLMSVGKPVWITLQHNQHEYVEAGQFVLDDKLPVYLVSDEGVYFKPYDMVSSWYDKNVDSYLMSELDIIDYEMLSIRELEMVLEGVKSGTYEY